MEVLQRANPTLSAIKFFENSILDGATAIGMKKPIRPQTNHTMHDLSKALSRSALFTNPPSEGT